MVAVDQIIAEAYIRIGVCSMALAARRAAHDSANASAARIEIQCAMHSLIPSGEPETPENL